MFKIIANDKNIIPYRKELNLITGGALESIFLAQLLYWYEVNDGNEFFNIYIYIYLIVVLVFTQIRRFRQ